MNEVIRSVSNRMEKILGNRKAQIINSKLVPYVMQYERLLLGGIPFEWYLSRPGQWKKDYFL